MRKEWKKTKTKYMWKRYPPKCRGGVALPADTTEACIDVVKVVLLAALIFLPLMVLLVFVLYRRSKNIEYKYEKLVMSGGTAPSQVCAIDQSESSDEQDDDDDKVIFQRRKARLAAKKNKANGLNGDRSQLLSSDVGV